MTRLLPLSLLALGLALAARPALAIEDDQFVLRASAFRGDGRIDVNGQTTYQGQPYVYNERFDTGKSTVPLADLQVRLGNRHRLIFNYVDFDGDRDGTLDQAISYGTVTIPAGSTARGEAALQLLGGVYDFAVAETENVSAGLQIGAQRARISGRVRAVAGANVYDERDSDSGWLPVLGARLAFAPATHWRIEGQAQHVNASWVNTDNIEGKFTLARAIAEYRFGGRFGVHAGYQWMRLDLRDPRGGNGVNGFDMRFDGPVVGLTAAF